MEALFYEELLQGGIAWTRTLSLGSLGSRSAFWYAGILDACSRVKHPRALEAGLSVTIIGV